MQTGSSERGVERMFPFLMRARVLIVGRENLLRSKRRLHFLLITKDLSANSREKLLSGFRECPIVQCYTSADLETHFGLRNTKVVGFRKSTLAQSVYKELKQFRVEAGAAGEES